MRDARLVGVQPWFPWPLSRWRWWTEPVPAERVAALRVAAAVALLLDIGVCYLPHFAAMFSPDVAGGRDLFAPRFRDHFYWSALRPLPAGWGPAAVFAVWVASAAGLLAGWRPLVCGLVAWACAVSVWSAEPTLHNGGDRLRNTLLLMTAVSCSGAAWGVSRVRNESGDRRPVLVPGWPVKVLFVQLALMYFFSGYYKLISPLWRSGYAMYWASHDLAWSLAPAQAALLPDWAHRLSALVALAWELGFPALALWRPTRAATLLLGVFFHLGTLLTLEVGNFALYSIACYAAFAPWERLRRVSREPGASAPAEPPA